VQALMVLVASLYLWSFASLAGLAISGVPGGYSSGTVRALATEGSTVAVIQLLSAISLVVTGILALTRRSRPVRWGLIAALAVQLLLAAYWVVRLAGLWADVSGPDPVGAFATGALFFVAAPAVGIGLLLTGQARRWFDGTAPG
jgi:hypothetical protein